ncbi:hypothetical protein [Verrucomicrobium spinosum]|uniref:hypothetical protein n=1 Tax=Verrucomicrobium spinosum TaxID=2736 RepID=UPI0012E1F078|nr:hypothetical protein [Verrucomicrobium spinosum]
MKTLPLSGLLAALCTVFVLTPMNTQAGIKETAVEYTSAGTTCEAGTSMTTPKPANSPQC